MKPKQITHLLRLSYRAKPGPWEVSIDGRTPSLWTGRAEWSPQFGPYTAQARANVDDAKFMAAARDAPPTALAEIKRLRHELAAMKKQVPDKTAVMLRLTPEELARLDALADKLLPRMPMASRSGVAHAALLLGLAQIEADLTVLLPKPTA